MSVDGPGDGGRAQSEVVGLVLLLGLSTMVIGVVVVSGWTVADDAKESAQVAQAENELREFDGRASRVAYGETGSAQVAFDHGTDDATVNREDGAWLRVRVVTGRQVVEVTNASMGTLVYDRGETEVAYQGGGVWRSDGGHSVMRSPPDVTHENGTLVVDAVSIGGDTALDGPSRIERRDRQRAYPMHDASGDDDAWSGRTNPFGTGTVAVTVHSDYYEAWGRYFEENLAGTVTYDHDAETATLWFTSNRGRRLETGIIATSRVGRLELEGTGAYVDSYNSSEGDYATTATADGRVEAVGDVNITGNGEIAGDIDAGNVVSLSGSSTVDGDVNWTDDYEDGTSTTVTGDTREIDGVPPMPPIDGVVYGTVDHVRRSNDNDATPVIANDRLSIGGGSAELGPGRYYLDHLNLSGEELVLNTTDGDITLAVRDWVHLERESGTAAGITVKGDGQVRMFVASRNEVPVSITGLGQRRVNLHAGKKTEVTVPDQDSNRLWVYAPRDFRATVAGDSSPHKPTFDGVIYAPAGDDGTGYTYVKQAEVFGAIVTGELTLGQYGLVHFDRGLPRSVVYRPPTQGIEFLHVTVYRLNASS